jgi:hypothetical protein
LFVRNKLAGVFETTFPDFRLDALFAGIVARLPSLMAGSNLRFPAGGVPFGETRLGWFTVIVASIVHV